MRTQTQQRNVQGNNPTEGVGSGRVDPSVEAKGGVGAQFQADAGYVGRTGRIDSSPTDCNIPTLTVVPIAAERNKVATLAVAINKGEIGNALERDPAEVLRANVLVRPVMGTPRVIKNGGCRNGTL